MAECFVPTAPRRLVPLAILQALSFPALVLTVVGCAHPADAPPLSPAVLAPRVPGFTGGTATGGPPKSSGSPVTSALPAEERTEWFQAGTATWYGKGRTTANGESFDPAGFTAAHKTLPFGTLVVVVRRDTGRSVRVRINDRGPFGSADRIIDLARGAASAIDLLRAGVAPVDLYVVKP